ncbi:hypothetical protein ALNOE001_20150 [Candidatus Methanobinarius endosymbioticus]|uniref:Uncharacterized protein n=1 Tax=Candidatus Methanobinarius endosymbioticus TaxID=2006182 RepID=A0A366M7Y0_9EURY|nr:hypothetical protein ALNOE001_20150 [Candidatus Methanobinarius endosymbioticus]
MVNNKICKFTSFYIYFYNLMVNIMSERIINKKNCIFVLLIAILIFATSIAASYAQDVVYTSPNWG